MPRLEGKEMRAGNTGDASTSLILVVAPDAGVRKMLHLALKVEFASEILLFSNARDALEAVKSAIPDIIIVHSLLPHFDTHKFATQIHGIRGRESVPIILTHEQEAPDSKGQEPDQVILLEQPFMVENLYSVIQACLDPFE